MSQYEPGTCRIDGGELFPVMSLGRIYQSDFPAEPGTVGTPFEIKLGLGRKSGLLQMYDSPVQSDIHQHYWYRSSINDSMVQSLRDVIQGCSRWVQLKDNDAVLSIACFPSGNLITPEYKPKDISQVVVGDRVLSQDGTFTEVSKTYARNYSGPLHSIKVRGSSVPLQATSEHPFLVVTVPSGMIKAGHPSRHIVEAIKPDWKAAKDIQSGDWLVIPKTGVVGSNVTLTLSDYVDGYVNGNTIMPLAWNSSQSNQPNYIRLTNSQDVDVDLARLLGYYVAEGATNSTKRSGLCFAFNSSERVYIEDVTNLLKDKFSNQLKITECNGKGKAVAVRVNSILLGSLFTQLCGCKAPNKQVPSIVMQSGSDVKASFLRGLYAGDGSVSDECIKLDSVSTTLVHQVRYLLREFGINSSLVPNRPNGYGKANGLTLWSVRVYHNKDLRALRGMLGEPDYLEPCRSDKASKSHSNYINTKDYTLARVMCVESSDFSGMVYNVETNNHTYVVDSYVVHNCNDGQELKLWTEVENQQGVGLYKVGIDPAQNLTNEARFWADSVECDYFSEAAFQRAAPGRKAKVITSIAVFYDLDDPVQFCKDVRAIMTDDGVWCCQMSYMPLMLQQNAFDNADREHVAYYSIEAFQQCVEAAGMRIIDVELNDVNCGSFRCYATPTANNSFRPPLHTVQLGEYRVKGLISHERTLKLTNPKTYEDFVGRVQTLKNSTLSLLREIKRQGKSCMGVGASTKGNVLLQCYGITPDLVSCIADRSPDKWGRYCIGSNIPIVSEEEMRSRKPDYLLILPWTFTNYLVEREAELMKNGTRMIVPLPELRILER